MKLNIGGTIIPVISITDYDRTYNSAPCIDPTNVSFEATIKITPLDNTTAMAVISVLSTAKDPTAGGIGSGFAWRNIAEGTFSFNPTIDNSINGDLVARYYTAPVSPANGLNLTSAYGATIFATTVMVI